MTVPKLHTYAEALAHLDAGGAIFRFGSYYPLYVNTGDGAQTRFDGGSSGEMIKWGWQFSADEQHSINWVLVSKEDQIAADNRYREAWQEIERRNAEERKQRIDLKPVESKKGWLAQLLH